MASVEFSRLTQWKPSRLQGLNSRRIKKLRLVKAQLRAGLKSDSHPATYGKSNDLWLSTEAERLKSMKKHQTDGLILTRGKWNLNTLDGRHVKFTGLMKFLNTTPRSEVFVSEVNGSTILLSGSSVDAITTTVKVKRANPFYCFLLIFIILCIFLPQKLPQIISKHPNQNHVERKDGYWQAYIIRAGESTSIQVDIEVTAVSEADLSQVKALRLDLSYFSYGPKGRNEHTQHVILPLKFPDPGTDLKWRKLPNGLQVLPIPTHLLCHLDDPLTVINSYVVPHVQPGDVLAIGETPLAIMQGRFRHPSSVRPGFIARLACRFFHPTSSLATACGMQVLVDIVGRFRVFLSVVGAAIARLFGKRGMFYVLAGEQARLIDDVTGTLPPYDQFITLGPVRANSTVDGLKSRIGVDVAVVDVNDLKRVQILAASQGTNEDMLAMALRDNPAGNGDEQTPLLLVRPCA